MTEISPGKLTGLRRLADEGGRFKMLAVDQRPPIINLIRDRLREGADEFSSVTGFKETLVETLGPASSAVLVDPQYVFPKIIPELPHGTGTLITLEHHKFEDTPTGRLSSPIPDWNVGKIKLAGGDAVKVLAWYRPDASDSVREHQKRWVASVGQECRRFDIPFVFELLISTRSPMTPTTPPGMSSTGRNGPSTSSGVLRSSPDPNTESMSSNWSRLLHLRTSWTCQTVRSEDGSTLWARLQDDHG